MSAPGGSRGGSGGPGEGLCVLIVGAGLMGTSMAMALTKAGHEVFLADREGAVARRAAELAGATVWTRGDDAEVDARIDLAVAAVPPESVSGVMSALLSLNPRVTVSDLCSVKANPLADVEASGADMSRVVGGHPVAGREYTGPEHALDTLFEDRPWVLCPSVTASSRAVQVADRAVRDCGAIPIVMSASEHDRVLAMVSHMPQLVASAVAGALLGLEPQDLRLAGPGVRDVTRIAGSSPELWRQILDANGSAVQQVLAEVARVLSGLASGPGDTFADRAHDVIANGNRGRALLPDKGLRPVLWHWVQVALADESGQLGRLFMTVGAEGVNIEDVRIRHADGGSSGWALMAVAQDSSARLASALEVQGWRCEVHVDPDWDVLR